MIEVYVGIDAGGTKTIALVGQPGDVVLGRGEAGPANPQAVGFDAAATAIQHATRAALAAAGLDSGQVMIARLAAGVAGAGRVADRARLGPLVAERLDLPKSSVQIFHDPALLLPTSGLASGVALVAGTGSSAFGIGPDGRTASAGGWGYLLGDEGSAFAVGRDAVRAVLRADDGFGPPTRLTADLLRELGLGQPQDLIRVIYQSASPRTTVASLAPLVAGAARAGDETAVEILAGASRDLGQIAGTVAQRLGLAPGYAVVGTGGMLQAGDVFVAPLHGELTRSGAGRFQILEQEAAIGALRLATGDVVLDLESH
jgi:N-acetylglucosamine kinase-like BadF-type ATPase